VESFAEDTPAMLSELQGLLRAAAEAPRGRHEPSGSGADGEGGGGADGGNDGFSKTVADARAVLHKLKGSALTLGACAVGAACEAVRARCISGDLQATLAPSGEGTYAALHAAFNEVMGARGSCSPVLSCGNGRLLLSADAAPRADVLNKYTALQAQIAQLED
jgi:HPt (histidine-containing phosphotransfer) domain-containing protein